MIGGRGVVGLGLALLVGLGAGCGAGERAGGGTEWRFALEEIEGSVQHAAAERFREHVEQATDGAVRVTVYPYGALGSSAEITEQVQSGALQLAFASPGHLGAVVPEVQVFSLHFLLPEDEAGLRRLLGAERVLAPLREAYRERRLALLAIVSEGWMVWSGDRPLRSPADFEGFKMRTMTSPLLVEAYRAYGADPTPLPYAEVYGALQLGMVDGQVNPVFAIEEMRFHEVQAVLTAARHLPFVTTLAANPAFVDGLDPSLRGVLDDAVAALEAAAFEAQRRLNAERLEQILAEGGTEWVTLDPAERQRFEAASRPLRARYAELAGARGERVLEAIAGDS